MVTKNRFKRVVLCLALVLGCDKSFAMTAEPSTPRFVEMATNTERSFPEAFRGRMNVRADDLAIESATLNHPTINHVTNVTHNYTSVPAETTFFGDVKSSVRTTLVAMVAGIIIQVPIELVKYSVSSWYQKRYAEKEGQDVVSDPSMTKEVIALKRQHDILMVLEEQAAESDKRAVSASDKEQCEKTHKNLAVMRAAYLKKMNALTEALCKNDAPQGVAA